MKKIAISLLCPLFVGLMFTSCLPDNEETELSSAVALLSFKINDLKTQHNITLDNGKDSTYTSIMKTSFIQFTIDQERGLVYNNDSIAYGTDITRVVTDITADGYVYYYKDGEKIGYNKEDSIDFTKPVRFTIISHDDRFSRDYQISVNRHKVDPKKTAWTCITNSTFPAKLYAEQKSVIKDDQLFVLGKGRDGYYYTISTDITDGTEWTAATKWNGINDEVDCTTIMLHDNKFYLLAGNQPYHSENGIDWVNVPANTSLSCLIPSLTIGGEASAWSISNGCFAESSDMVTWTSYGQHISDGVDHIAGAFCQPLNTNKYIYRTLFVGTSSESTDTCAQVWSKLSNDTKWVKVVPKGTNVYGCPNLENLTVIKYRDNMYAFGGKSIGDRHIPIESFSACFESRDNGVTWRVRDNAFSLPESFAGNDDTFSAVVDKYKRVWFIWSTSGEIWRGAWSGTY